MNHPPLIQPCDFVLVHGDDDIVASAVQRFTKSHWDHVAVVARHEHYGMGFIEATMNGVGWANLEDYIGKPNVEYVPIGMADTVRELGNAYLLSRLGDRYDWLEIIGIFLHRCFRINLSIDYTDICSGLCGEMLERMGYPMLRDGAYLTPANLAAIFQVTPR